MPLLSQNKAQRDPDVGNCPTPYNRVTLDREPPLLDPVLNKQGKVYGRSGSLQHDGGGKIGNGPCSAAGAPETAAGAQTMPTNKREAGSAHLREMSFRKSTRPRILPPDTHKCTRTRMNTHRHTHMHHGRGTQLHTCTHWERTGTVSTPVALLPRRVLFLLGSAFI